MMALTGGRPTSPGATGSTLPAGVGDGHLQLLDADRVACAPICTPSRCRRSGARFRRSSRMEPLVDGDETFARLLTDIEQAKGATRPPISRAGPSMTSRCGSATSTRGWSRSPAPSTGTGRDQGSRRPVPAGHGRGARQPQPGDGAAVMALIGIANAPAAGTRDAGVTDAIGLGLWVLLAAAAIANWPRACSRGTHRRRLSRSSRADLGGLPRRARRRLPHHLRGRTRPRSTTTRWPGNHPAGRPRAARPAGPLGDLPPEDPGDRQAGRQQPLRGLRRRYRHQQQPTRLAWAQRRRLGRTQFARRSARQPIPRRPLPADRPRGLGVTSSGCVKWRNEQVEGSSTPSR